MLRRVAALSLVAALAACASKARLPTVPLTLGGERIIVEVADEEAERAQGLMYRERLDADKGMLFVYPAPEPLSFWMKNTKIPLSIAFIGADQVIFRIADLKPFDRSSVSSVEQAQYALEMNRGWFDAHRITEGTHIEGLPDPVRR